MLQNRNNSNTRRDIIDLVEMLIEESQANAVLNMNCKFLNASCKSPVDMLYQKIMTPSNAHMRRRGKAIPE